MDYLRISVWTVLLAVVVSVHTAPYGGHHHTHTIIHVPTRVHTVHHHHVKKVKVPVYVHHKHTHLHHEVKPKVSNHYHDHHHHEEDVEEGGDEYEDDFGSSWHRQDGPSRAPGGDDADLDEHYDEQPVFLDSLEATNDFEEEHDAPQRASRPPGSRRGSRTSLRHL